MKIMRIGDINIATKWHELGIMLIHSYSAIQEIEANHNDVSTCYCKTQEKQGIFAYVRGLPPQKRKAVQSRTYAAFVMKRS